MIDGLAYEDLIKLVDQVEAATNNQPSVFFTQNVWLLELKHHPDRFYRNNDGELMCLGGKVVVLGDGKRFWSMADKIIPKEINNND
jgi:hypothetical protein